MTLANPACYARPRRILSISDRLEDPVPTCAKCGHTTTHAIKQSLVSLGYTRPYVLHSPARAGLTADT